MRAPSSLLGLEMWHTLGLRYVSGFYAIFAHSWFGQNQLQIDLSVSLPVEGMRLTLVSDFPDPVTFVTSLEARVGDSDPGLSADDPNACLKNSLCFRTEEALTLPGVQKYHF